MDYYTTLIVLLIMAAIVLIINTCSNSNFNKRTKNGFITALVFIIVGAVCEWIGEAINGKFLFGVSQIDIAYHYFIKLLEQIVVPIMAFMFADALFVDNKEDKKSLAMQIFLSIFVATELISVQFGKLVFYVDKNNVYHHGKFYWIYVFTYISAVLYMIYRISCFSKKIQKKNTTELSSIVFFLAAGVIIQAINPDVKTCWIAIIMSMAMFYMYYINIIQYVDGLTSLLNQKCYNNWLDDEAVKEAFTIIIIDINLFSYINNKCGHRRGDEILKKLGVILKEVYQKYGRCYRIGGDEFGIVLELNVDAERLRRELNKKIIPLSNEIYEGLKMEKFPILSYGSSTYNPESRSDHNVFKAIEEADLAMYAEKEEVHKMCGVEMRKWIYVRTAKKAVKKIVNKNFLVHYFLCIKLVQTIDVDVKLW